MSVIVPSSHTGIGLFLASSVLVANPRKLLLHGGQSRAWSAEQYQSGIKDTPNR